MYRFGIVLGVVLIAASCTPRVVSAPRAAAPIDHAAIKPPPMIAPDSTGVTPTAYRLALAIDPEAGGYTGTVSIDVTLTEPTDTIWLDDDGPHVTAATITADAESTTLAPIDGAPAGRVGFTLPRTTSGEIRLDLAFSADYRGEDGIFAQSDHTHSYVYSDFEPTDARRAFPCFDEPRWKTPWSMTLTVPAGVTALSNTSPTSDTPLADGRREIAFATTAPLPTYLVALAVGPFETVDAPGAPVPMRIVVPAGRSADAARAAGFAPALAGVAQTLLARPIPFDKIDVIAVPRFGGAMENPGLITVASDILLDGHGDGDDRQLALVLAHELSHLWFGDSVTLVDWRDLWINEGVASWMADEVLARWRPAWATRRDELRARDEAMADDEIAGAHPLRPAALDKPRQLFDVLTYQKGASILHMLDGWIGGDRMLDALRGFLDAHAGGGASSDDLLAALAPLGDDVGGVMRGLVDGAGVPEIDATLDCRGAPHLHLTVRDAGDRVPVCARWSDGTTHRACTVVSGADRPAARRTLPDLGAPRRRRQRLLPLDARRRVAGRRDRRRRRERSRTPRRRAGDPARARRRRVDARGRERAARRHRQPDSGSGRRRGRRLSAAARRGRAARGPPRDRRAPARRPGRHLAPPRHRPAPRRARRRRPPARGRAHRRRRARRRSARDRVGAPRARRWLHHHRAATGALLEPALVVAGAHADDRLATQLFRAAEAAMSEPDEVGELLARALGRMPRRRAMRALDAGLGGELPSPVTFALAVELLGRGDTARAAAHTLGHRGDWLATTVTFASTCDPALVDRLAKSRDAERDPGYARSLSRRRLEAQRCAAMRPRATGAARAFGLSSTR